MNQKEANYRKYLFEKKHLISFPTTMKFVVSEQKWRYRNEYYTLESFPSIHYLPFKPSKMPVRPPNKRQPNETMAAYEKAHNGRFYGSSVKQRKDGWTCLDLTHTSLLRAPTLEDLVLIAPYIFRSNIKPKPIPSNRKPSNRKPKPLFNHLKGIPKELHNYTFVQGFNVRKRHGLFTCLSADKTQTLGPMPFDTLLTIPYLKFTLNHDQA